MASGVKNLSTAGRRKRSKINGVFNVLEDWLFDLHKHGLSFKSLYRISLKINVVKTKFTRFLNEKTYLKRVYGSNIGYVFMIDFHNISFDPFPNILNYTN